MRKISVKGMSMPRSTKGFKKLMQLAGLPYWTAPLLPALIGTTLPFWLHPPGFTFSLPAAILFLLVTWLGFVGFSWWHSALTHPEAAQSFKTKNLFIAGGLSLALAILLAWHLNNRLSLHTGVPDYTFVVYGAATLFTGVLYVFPPFSFHRRLFGEVVLGVGLGMLPILGAYFVQVGDLTRTVYLASLPVVLATGLWNWMINLSNYDDDMRLQRKSTVMFFPYQTASRVITLALVVAICASLVLAVVVRSSLPPLSLLALVSLPLAARLIRIVWTDPQAANAWPQAKRYAVLIHLTICMVIMLTTLFAGYR
ncbi:MAG: UbiA family prenyltransferase [Lewinella sp.]|nr:UbiA family prenyltransferase [Lewinella sp.]